MRNINRSVTVVEQVTVNKAAASEDFKSIWEQKTSRMIYVTVAVYDSSGSVLEEKDYKIDGSKYDLLMSESPSFAPGKPVNEYRESDIWHIIDLIRSE